MPAATFAQQILPRESMVASLRLPRSAVMGIVPDLVY